MSMTATEVAKECNISRSYLYYLKKNQMFNVDIDINGRPVWEKGVCKTIKQLLESKKVDNLITESPYKTTKINNRRYLGNKYRLLSFIKDVVDKECEGIDTVADVFAGTGAVASAFVDKKIITNDIMYSNYICHKAWFDSEIYSEEKIIELILYYNNLHTNEKNYMTDNFANTYFSLQDCSKIGFIRENIEQLYNRNEINGRERALLITSLLYAMDKIANTCGHYDAYRKGVEYDKHLELYVPTPESNINPNNVCYNKDTNELIKNIEADLVYIDPPYNSRQYCDAYHVLENVARWEKPEVFGVARKMDRTNLKSDYCTQKATEAFEYLINNVSAKYIILSYNNMSQKGNDRSNAKINDEDIFRILGKKGSVKVYSESYKAFTAGKSDIKENEERLFVCKCYDDKKSIQSPLNYTGGKYKLLPQIMKLFPEDCEQVVDLFCGGCNVGINVKCNKVLFNDQNTNLINLIKTFLEEDKSYSLNRISKIIDFYNLSRSDKNGYEYYGCKSSDGLAKYNKEHFLNLREEFNRKKIKDSEYYYMQYVLILYAFNNQIRFNKKGKYNLPVGKRDYNVKMQIKLSDFIDRIKSGDYKFISEDFRQISLSEFSEKTFFYVDPPYLITCATYNEQSGWTEKDEGDLLNYLDDIHSKGMKFALSNVIESKGKINSMLLNWIRVNSDKYYMHELVYDYSNSNYQTDNKNSKTKEVLVTNYLG